MATLDEAVQRREAAIGTLIEILCAEALFASTLQASERPSSDRSFRSREPSPRPERDPPRAAGGTERPGRHVCRKEGQRGTGLLLPLDS